MDCKENDENVTSGEEIVTSLETPLAASVINPTMEEEQMGDGNSVSKEDEERSEAVCCVDKETQEPGVQAQGSGSSVSKELEEDSDAVCNETQKPGVVSDDEASVSDADVPCGTLLPIGVSETGTESAFLNDAPEKVESLETARDLDSDEAGNGGLNCTVDVEGKEGSKEPSGDQDAGFSDDVSVIRSCPFPESVLDSGGLAAARQRII